MERRWRPLTRALTDPLVETAGDPRIRGSCAAVRRNAGPIDGWLHSAGSYEPSGIHRGSVSSLRTGLAATRLPSAATDRAPRGGGQLQAMGRGLGWAAAYDALAADTGSARTWSFGIVPCGPSDVCSQSCSLRGA